MRGEGRQSAEQQKAQPAERHLRRADAPGAVTGLTKVKAQPRLQRAACLPSACCEKRGGGRGWVVLDSRWHECVLIGLD